MSRSVVLLQGVDSTPDLTPLLAAQQWHAHRATHPDQVTSFAGSASSHVGIAVFDTALPCSLSEFTRLAQDSRMEWIAVLPANYTHDRASAQALALNFFDYHTLPVDGPRLLYAVGHAHGRALLRHSVAAPIEPARRFHMIGESPRMTRLYSELEKVLRSRAPLLITGESGVGKELAARAVHLGSTYGRGPYMPVNCGALPQQLVESLLFGHEKGAFTGAHERRIGSIEAAAQGTIFLDEIGDLPLVAQASLLRFLQESTIVRVGSTHELHINTRVIAATHIDLNEAVRSGQFREDLFYRLNVLNVDVPALRDRGADCILLAEHFFNGNPPGRSPSVRGFSEDAIAAIRRHSWPGNVRELLNRVQRAVVMCDGPLIGAEDLQLNVPHDTRQRGSLAGARVGSDRALVEATLAQTGYNIAASARELGISRLTLYRLLNRLRIRIQPGREALARQI
jgi:DNA-binding NtrC family response regulator